MRFVIPSSKLYSFRHILSPSLSVPQTKRLFCPPKNAKASEKFSSLLKLEQEFRKHGSQGRDKKWGFFPHEGKQCKKILKNIL